MRFSIIIPIFNGEDFIGECLNSLISQTYKSFEIIIVNDGSTDSSRSICEVYQEKYDNIRVFSKENGGQFSARLFAISKCNGDYVVPIDADDCLRNDCLDIINNNIDENTDLVFFNMSTNCDYCVPLMNYDFSKNVFTTNEKKELFETLLKNCKLNSFCGKAYKRDLLFRTKWDESNIRSIRNGEDYLQVVPLFINAERIKYIPEIMYYYRPNVGSVSHRFIPTFYKSRMIIFDYLESKRDLWEALGIDFSLVLIRTAKDTVNAFFRVRYDEKKKWKEDINNIVKDSWTKTHYWQIPKAYLSLLEKTILRLIYKEKNYLLLWILKITNIVQR